ncbi:hypothetical protein CLV75_0404 [Ruegeria conchae]|uniref:Uncharacterized protein n=1 Tax=Ruegeria conchae TaxID=981384 RepID=A0A497ZT82_9RHOB|nr:hypothetical protein CLV75_0404 [Ruegeria conchae]
MKKGSDQTGGAFEHVLKRGYFCGSGPIIMII